MKLTDSVERTMTERMDLRLNKDVVVSSSFLTSWCDPLRKCRVDVS